MEQHVQEQHELHQWCPYCHKTSLKRISTYEARALAMTLLAQLDGIPLTVFPDNGTFQPRTPPNGNNN